VAGPICLRLLFIHSWKGFSLAEWYMREAAARAKVRIEVRGLALPADGVPPDDRLVRTLACWRPTWVGFSCHYWSAAAFVASASVVKHLCADTRVVLGGPQVASIEAAAAVLEKHRNIDFIIRGRGDEALPRLLEHDVDPEAVRRETIPGLSYRTENGLRHSPESLAPPRARGPIFHRANRELTEHLLHLSEASYETLTGCRCRCRYCVYPTGKVVTLDDDMVMSELAYLCDLGVPHLRVCDAHFGGTAGRAKKLLRHLARVNRRTSVKIYPDVRHVDEEYVSLVEAAGAEVTSIGIQSTNPECLKRVRRPVAHDAQREIEVLLGAFPTIPADLIVGLPGDTLDGLSDTFRDVLALGFSRVNLFRLHLFPGSELGADPAAHFDPGKTTATEHGQVLSSPRFPVSVQQDVAHLCYAMELAAPLVRTRALSGSPSRIFDALVEKVQPEALLDLHAVMYPFHPERLLSQWSSLVEKLASLADLDEAARDALVVDLVEYLRVECAARRCDRLEWEDGERRRVVSQVLVPLRRDAFLSWSLRVARVEQVSRAPSMPTAQDVLLVGPESEARGPEARQLGGAG
jgi:radical SAM superfamily enzyme YgiQ (UPF0313 family)